MAALPPLLESPRTPVGHATAATSTDEARVQAERGPETPSRFRSLPLFVSTNAKGRAVTPQGTSRPGGTSPLALRPSGGSAGGAAATTAALAASLQALRPDTAASTSPSGTARIAAASLPHAWTSSPATSGLASGRPPTTGSSAGGAYPNPASRVGTPHYPGMQQQQPPLFASSGGGARPSTSSMHTASPPLFTPLGARPATTGDQRPGTATFKDLLTATRKSLAAGMGEWDLQPLAMEWEHPAFRSRLFQGPLGPENLKTHHGMHERDIVQLYRVLYMYSTGFCTSVLEAVQSARGREALLESVVEAYAGLWDEALGVVFRSEVVDVLRGKTGALGAAEQLSAQLTQSRDESAALHMRLNEFVRGTIDNMLTQRALRDQAAAAEAEALMLNKSSDAMGVRLAGAEVKVHALMAQVEAAQARAAAAEAAVAERDAALGRARAALAEQQAQLSRQYFQMTELERTAAAERAAYAAERAERERQDAERAAAEAAGSGESAAEVERRLADRTLAYNLLRSDYVVKMHDLDELRDANAELNTRISHMGDTYNTAKRQIEASEAKAEKYRVKWEKGRMYTADLESGNRRLGQRNRELVASYWPLMERLKEAEAAAKDAAARAEEAEQRRREAEERRAEAEDRLAQCGALEAEIERLRSELALENSALPESTLSAIHPEAASARAFVRASQRRIADLSTQLVRLVDVHAGCAKRIHQHEVVEGALRSKILALDAQLKAKREEPGPKATSEELRASLAVAVQKLADERRERGDAEVRALKAEAAAGVSARRLETWLSAVATQAASLRTACDAAMAKDPDSPVAHLQAAMLEVERRAAEEAAAAVATAAAAAAAASGEGGEAEGATDEGNREGKKEVGGTEKAEEEAGKKTEEEEALPALAAGRLATEAGEMSEAEKAVVRVDWRWEQLCDCVDRLLDWSGCLLDKKLQVHHLTDLKSQLTTATAALQQTRQEADALRTQLQVATERLAKLEASSAADAETASRCKSAAEESESARAALESGFRSAQEQVASLTRRLTNIEEEYWGAKSKLLAAELQRDELVASKERALAVSEKADSALKRMEREAEEHRLMRQKLELDLIGCKAWIRGMEETEREHRVALAALAQAQDAARAQAALIQELQAKLPAGSRGSDPPTSSARSEVEAAVRKEREAEQRLLELRAVVAEARRRAEDAEARLRHAEADKEILGTSVSDLRAALSEQEARSRALQQQVWELGLAVRGADAERKLVLERAVDERFRTGKGGSEY